MRDHVFQVPELCHDRLREVMPRAAVAATEKGKGGAEQGYEPSVIDKPNNLRLRAELRCGGPDLRFQKIAGMKRRDEFYNVILSTFDENKRLGETYFPARKKELRFFLSLMDFPMVVLLLRPP